MLSAANGSCGQALHQFRSGIDTVLHSVFSPALNALVLYVDYSNILMGYSGYLGKSKNKTDNHHPQPLLMPPYLMTCSRTRG